MQAEKARQLSSGEKAFKERLKSAIDKGGGFLAFCKAVEISTEQARKWINLKHSSMPSLQFLLKIGNYFGPMKMVYIVTGEEAETLVPRHVRIRLVAELDSLQNVIALERSGLVEKNAEVEEMFEI